MTRLLTALSLLWAVCALSATASANSCKCYPEDPCWPSAQSWSTFNNTLHGKLIKSVPPAASCHQGPLYDATQCLYVQNNWNSSVFHAENPISIDFPSFANSSCVPTADPTLPCTLGYFPVYSVNATETADVQAAVLFAKANNLRLVIKNTGHSFLGGSTGRGALNVWTHHIKGLTFTEHFVPRGASHIRAVPAVTMGAGDQWGEVYAQAEKLGKVVVGGNNPTVGSSGGYLQGGGHSPVGTRYGLASDQALEFEVVLANGNVVTANQFQNPDLFWALRGGGGGTYGVVTKATIKTFKTPATDSLVLNFEAATEDLDGFLEACAYIHTQLPTISDKGVQGYYNVYAGQFISVFNVYDSNGAALNASMASIMSKLDTLQTAGKIAYQSSVTRFPTFYQSWQASVNIDPVGYNGVLGTWLLPRKALETDLATAKKLLNATLPPLGAGALIGNFVAGGQVIGNKNLDTGVNDGWRSAYLNFGIFQLWADGTAPADQQAVRDDLTYNKMPLLKALAPASGTYVNEADVNSPTWQSDYFGTKYNKLKSIKDRYDPTGFFYCYHCVGSEKWTSNDGRLCRASA
ncbi:hypothetical protein RI367_006425 [Sorochytrium milnesiophthora]